MLSEKEISKETLLCIGNKKLNLEAYSYAWFRKRYMTLFLFLELGFSFRESKWKEDRAKLWSKMDG